MGKEYDEAIAFYTQQLDFTLVADTQIDAEKRWVLLAPPKAKECCLLLAKSDELRMPRRHRKCYQYRFAFYKDRGSLK